VSSSAHRKLKALLNAKAKMPVQVFSEIFYQFAIGKAPVCQQDNLNPKRRDTRRLEQDPLIVHKRTVLLD
jgi:hypothetical protein